MQTNVPNLQLFTSLGYNDKNFGQHGVSMFFFIRGSKGAVVWEFNTGVSPSGWYPSADENSNLLQGVNISFPRTSGVSAHSELTLDTATEDESGMSPDCQFLEGRACVCTMSSFTDKSVIQRFACEGLPGVAEELKTIYEKTYGEPYV